MRRYLNVNIIRPRRSRSTAAYSDQLSRGRSVCLFVRAYVRRKTGESDLDAVWHHMSDGSRDEAGNGVWGSVHGKAYFWGRIFDTLL